MFFVFPRLLRQSMQEEETFPFFLSKKRQSIIVAKDTPVAREFMIMHTRQYLFPEHESFLGSLVEGYLCFILTQNDLILHR